jgi:hypothetical protein
MPPNPPVAPAVSGFHSRAMTPIQNPTYTYNQTADFKSAHPAGSNVLERPPRNRDGVDPRLTSAGSTPPVAGLPAYVPYAGQTPYNVWTLYPQ